MRARSVAVLLVLVAAFAPGAAGHIENFSQGQSIALGPYTAYVTPQPDVIYANTAMSIAAQVARVDTGSLVRNVPATLDISGPEGFRKTLELREDGRGSFVAGVLLPAPGQYQAQLTLRDEAGNHTGNMTFQAYPDLPFRLRSADLAQDINAGDTAELTFETIDPVNLTRKHAFDELTVRFEHWSEDHTQLLGEAIAVATEVAPGLWKTDYHFGEVGMYHMRFASTSGGFGYDDVPLLHLYATPPPPAEEKPAPAPGLVLLAAAGLVAATLMSRRA